MSEKEINRNIVLINAATNPISENIPDVPLRSFWTHQQRFEQTLETISSSRKNINHPFIILVEGTQLTDEQRKKYNEICDVVLDLSNNDFCLNIVNGFSKSFGECVSVYYGMKYILENNLKFNLIFKIVARNVFNNNFNFSLLFEDKMTFRMFENQHRKWYSSGFYVIGYERRWNFFESLLYCLFSMERRQIGDMEHNLYVHIPKEYVTLKDCIGISGTLGMNGTPFHH